MNKMPNNLNNITFFATSVTNGQKKRLLAAYCEYVSLVRTLEHIVRKHSVKNLANHQAYVLYTKYNENNPWLVDNITPQEQKLYNDFLVNKPIENRAYCFVSLNLSTSADEKQGIISAPQSYYVQTKTNQLPHRIERYVAAFPKEAGLKDTTFIINGKYVLTYKGAEADISVQKAFEDELIEKRFSCILDMMTQFPENLNNIDVKQHIAVQNETLASEFTAPYENMILSALSTLAEESNRALKDMVCRRKTDNYIYQAESCGIIPSAARMQQFLNIRHLMRHQWDTLDNIGKFTFYDTEKNTSIRHRYLDGYSSLCDKPLQERVSAYVTAAKDFSPLVAGLNPELFIRDDYESNSKFVSRIKEYQRKNTNAPLLIETAYTDTTEKKTALIRNIEKLFPTADIVDRKEIDMEVFCERIKRHIARNKFLEIFSELEYKISQYRLLQGKSQPVKNSWQDLASQQVLSPEEAKRWSEYRKLRNDLSHHHMDDELNARMEKELSSFFGAAIELEDKLIQNQPKVYLLKDNIFRAVHPNGLTVEIDFNTKRVLSVTNEKRTYRIKDVEPRKKGRVYTDEYPNKISITTAGSEIIACRLQNGTVINLASQKVVYPDNSKFYFNSEKHNTLVVNSAKILTDKQFHLMNYINNGKSVVVQKNETIILPNMHRLRVGGDSSIIFDSWTDEKGVVQKQEYNNKSLAPSIQFSDGTLLHFKYTGAVLSHNGIELSFNTRKAFVESYDNTLSPEMLLKNKKQR